MRVVLSLLAVAVAATGVIVAQGDYLDPAAGKSFTIAVVKDGPVPDEGILELIREELSRLVTETELHLKEDPSFDAGWQATRAGEALAQALADPEVDIVLAVGALVTQAAAQMPLSKPVVSSFVARDDLFGVTDLEGDHSSTPNLSTVMVPLQAETDLASFFGLVRFDVVHVAIEEQYAAHLRLLDERAREVESRVGLKIEFLPIGLDPEASVAAAGDRLQAVLLDETPRLSEAQRGQLLRALNDRRIPTFSMTGHRDVVLGALGSRTPDFQLFLARRLALNLSDLMRGASPEDLPAILPLNSRLLLNAETARLIGYLPSPEVLAFADFLHPEALRQKAAPLSMEEAMQMAEATNFELAIADQDVEIAFRNEKLTKTGFFPQLRLDPNAQNIRMRGLESVIPDTTAGLGLRFQQMIYDDQYVSDHKSASRRSDGVRQDREAQRLDAMNGAGQAFLLFAGTRVLYRVDLENLKLTEENLELAKVREKVGYSGKDEVFRWEAEVAKRKSQLLAREAEIETRRLALNQTLGIDQQTRWTPEEIVVDPESWPFLDGRLNPYGETMAGTARLLDVMVELAVESAPGIRAATMNIDAQEITLNQQKRRWYLPVFGLDATYDVDLYQSPEIEGVSNDFWSVRVVGRYPISEGGARKQKVRLASAEVARLQRQQDLQTSLVERATRSSWRQMEGSFATIRYNRIAAENAEKNLVVVQDKYAQGLVNVTDLLVAQNETFAAQQSVVVANYGFLGDLVEFQRSISWFESDKTDDDKERFLRRVEVEMQRSTDR